MTYIQFFAFPVPLAKLIVGGPGKGHQESSAEHPHMYQTFLGTWDSTNPVWAFLSPDCVAYRMGRCRGPVLPISPDRSAVHCSLPMIIPLFPRAPPKPETGWRAKWGGSHDEFPGSGATAQTLQLQSQQLKLDRGQWGRLGGHSLTAPWQLHQAGLPTVRLQHHWVCDQTAQRRCQPAAGWGFGREAISQAPSGPCAALQLRSLGHWPGNPPKTPAMQKCTRTKPGCFLYQKPFNYNLCMKWRKPFDCFLRLFFFFSQVLGGICTYICTQHFMGKRQTQAEEQRGQGGEDPGLDTSSTPLPCLLLPPPNRLPAVVK